MFTEKLIQALKPGPKRYERSERSGLRIRVTPKGVKSWVYIYRHHGRLRRLTLGTYPVQTLAQARLLLNETKVVRGQGKDPAAIKQAAVRELRTAESVKELANLYIERYAKLRKRTWKEDVRVLEKDILPSIGHLKIKDVRRADMIQIIDRVAARAPVAGNRTLEIARRMFNFAVERELLENNPCLKIPAPAKKKGRDRVLSGDELKALWKALDHVPNDPTLMIGLPTVLGFKLLLVTAQRRGELAQAAWDEFDLKNQWWTIPAGRSKNGLAHRVPLSPLALKLLENVRAASPVSDWLFPSPKGGPVDPHAFTRAVSRLRKVLKIEAFTVHDLRRTAASHMASIGIPRLTLSKILNHVETGVTATYDRHSYDAEKRRALERWARHLERHLEGESSNVIALVQRA